MGLKKQVEKEVREAIETVLSRQNKKALGKAGKSVREAARTIAKRFSKAMKNLDKEKKPVKKKTAKKKPAKTSTRKKKVRKKTKAGTILRTYPAPAPVMVTNGTSQPT